MVAALRDGRQIPTRRALGGAHLQRSSAAGEDGRAVAAGQLRVSRFFW